MEKQRFGGVQRLHGEKSFQKLQNSHVAVVGVGGVGSWACEALARNGIGEITLIDADDVCVTNINRQIHALTETIGHEKVVAMADRIKQINPDCKTNIVQKFFISTTSDDILNTEYDFVIDAIDSLKHKALLIAKCSEKNIPIISVGGAGGKKNVLTIQIDDLTKAHGDRLLSKLRANLRKEFGFPKASIKGKNKKFKIPSVFSPEPVKMPWSEPSVKQNQTSLKLDCNNGFGTDVTVISVFGLTAANYVIKKLII